MFKGNYTQYQNQYEQEQLEQQRQYEQYISEKQRLSQASKAKRNQAQQMAQASSKQNKSIAPDRLSASKQKARLRRCSKQAKHIEKEWNIWKKLKNHKVIMNSISHKIKFMISIIIIQSLHKI